MATRSQIVYGIWTVITILFIALDISLLVTKGNVEEGSIDDACLKDIVNVDGSFETSTTANTGTDDYIDPSSWINGAGAIGIILSVFWCTKIGCIFYREEIDDCLDGVEDVEINGSTSFCCCCILDIVLFIWTILGFVIYGEWNEVCQDSSIGQAVNIWCILKLMISILNICFCGLWCFIGTKNFD